MYHRYDKLLREVIGLHSECDQIKRQLETSSPTLFRSCQQAALNFVTEAYIEFLATPTAIGPLREMGFHQDNELGVLTPRARASSLVPVGGALPETMCEDFEYTSEDYAAAW